MRFGFGQVWVIVAIVSLVIGCGPEESGNGNNGQSGSDAGDVEQTDGGDTEGADAGDTRDEDADACVPITECSEGQCGTVHDGCGGTFECETACPCENGQPTQPTCGTCGLGKVECGGTGDGGSCVTPPLSDAVACTDIIYLDTDADSDGDGSASSPFASYESAVASAAAGQTIVIGGDSAIESTIEVVDGVSVIGGYDVDDGAWLFDPDKQNEVSVPAGDGDIFGLSAIDLSEETTVYGLDITTADAADGGSYDNYGTYVVGTDTLTLEFVDVFAGAGGSGADGAPGSSGQDGGVGDDALKAVEGCSTSGCPSTNTDGAAGGTNSACSAADGGAGGDGAINGGISAMAGEDAADALGGGAGTDSDGSRGGDSGEDAPAFQNPAADGAAQLPGGTVSQQQLWESEGAGLPGVDGQHGSGGGGGGGAWYFTPNNRDVGPGGGGGGAGGCGGTAGEGGQPGGGSFGLFAVNSDLSLVRSRFNASAGGDGGDGASGADGGAGALGGDGINLIEEYLASDIHQTVDYTYFSGDGGDGADGQGGGNGAGGAGGVSYGAYCKQSRLDQTDVEFGAGSAASGGAGPGAAGEAGLSAETQGCQ